MKIESITIEGMHKLNKPTTYTFEDMNYIFGTNGAGKSTILQAIQLALLGYIPGTNKKVGDIFKHSCGRKMEITLNLSGGVTIRKCWEQNAKSISCTEEITPDGVGVSSIVGNAELPILDFGGFMGLSSNMLKAWFINFLPKLDSKFDWDAELDQASLNADVVELDPEFRTQISEKLSKIKASGVDAVIEANQIIKDMLSSEKQNLAMIDGGIRSLIFYDDAAVSNYDAEIDNINQQLSQISDLRTKAVADKSKLETYNYLKSQQAETTLPAKTLKEDKEYISLGAKRLHCLDDIKFLKSNIAELREHCGELHDKCSAIGIKITDFQKTLSGNGMCPYSKAPCDTILNSMLDIRKNIAELNVQKVNLLDERAEIERTISELEARLKSDKQQETAYANRIQQLIAAYQQRDEIEQKLSEIVPDSDMDALVAAIAQYDQQAEALRVKLSHCIANKKYDETIDKFTNKKLTIQNHVDILNVWAKYTDANNLQTKVAMEQFAELEVKVDKYLTTLFHEDVKFRTELSTKANSFSFGIMRNNKYIPYELLSSGEKTLVAFSIMLYIASATTGTLKLVMVDDMLDHLDSENVYTLFERLSEVEGIQIITAGVKEVTNQIHKINI
jgi:DNA repair exonuclease SbcCD ATPase subunit